MAVFHAHARRGEGPYALNAGAGLPGQPRWLLAADHSSCSVCGWHLTPATIRLSWILTRLSTLALLILPVIEFWRSAAFHDAAYAWLWHADVYLKWRALTRLQLQCELAGAYACILLMWPWWQWLLTKFYFLLLKRRTCIRFTARDVKWGTTTKRFPRTGQASLTFLLQEYPNLAWVTAKCQQRGKADLAILFREARCLYLQYGLSLIEVARFVSSEEAQRWCAVAQWALQYPLKDQPSNSPATNSIANTPDT